MFHEEPPARREELRMRSHFAHSTPVGRPFMCSGQAPIVVPCNILALVGVEFPMRCAGNAPLNAAMEGTGEGDPLHCEVGVSAGEMLDGLCLVSFAGSGMPDSGSWGNRRDGGIMVILLSDLPSLGEDFGPRGRPVEAKADRKFVMAPGDRGGFILAAEGDDMTGSRKERVTSLSFPTLWMRAELFSDSMMFFSSSFISIE